MIALVAWKPYGNLLSDHDSPRRPAEQTTHLSGGETSVLIPHLPHLFVSVQIVLSCIVSYL